MKLKIHGDSLGPLLKKDDEKPVKEEPKPAKEIKIIVEQPKECHPEVPQPKKESRLARSRLGRKWAEMTGCQRFWFLCCCGQMDGSDCDCYEVVQYVCFGLLMFFGVCLVCVPMMGERTRLRWSAELIPDEMDGVYWDRAGRLDLEGFTKKYSPIEYQNDREDAMEDAYEFYQTVYDHEYPSQREIPEEFICEWVTYIMTPRKYYKPYEMLYRRSIFIHNKVELLAEEERNPGLDLEPNYAYLDRTDAELKKMLGKALPPLEGSAPYDGGIFEKNEGRPVSVDWVRQGKVSDVKDQGQCGSCWAFATVAAVESAFAIKNGSAPSLSEQELVDCDSSNNGCRGGYRPYAMRFVKAQGLVPGSSYPYTATEGDECKVKQITDARIYIDDYKTLPNNEDQIADWVAKNGPVTFGMNVTKNMYSYKSGIFNPSKTDCQTQSIGSHALTIVGYGAEGTNEYWIVKNSWGASWGAAGYFKLAKGVNACGMANIVVAPVINL